jgi:hypothetical protein
MTKTAQVLSRLNENFFDFFDFAVKKFCGSSLAHEVLSTKIIFKKKIKCSDKWE